jgi:hypothetical protein
MKSRRVTLKKTIRFLIPLQVVDVDLEYKPGDDGESLAIRAYDEMLKQLRYEVGFKPQEVS